MNHEQMTTIGKMVQEIYEPRIREMFRQTALLLKLNVWVHFPMPNTYYNPASDITIYAEDMPWELMPA